MTEQKKYAMQQEDDLGKMTQSIPLPVLQSWYDRAMEDYEAGRCMTVSQLDDMVKSRMGWKPNFHEDWGGNGTPNEIAEELWKTRSSGNREIEAW